MEIGDAEAAAEIDQRRRRARFLGQLARQSERRRLRLDQGGGIERLRAGEDVKAAPFGARRDDPADQGGHARRIDPERLGAAAHAHARALDLEVGIDPDGEPRRPPQLRADREGALGLAFGFAVERNARPDRLLEFGVALAGAGKADFGRIAAGLQGEAQFAARSDVEAVDLLRNVLQQLAI